MGLYKILVLEFSFYSIDGSNGRQIMVTPHEIRS
jgi:hypothetical protein